MTANNIQINRIDVARARQRLLNLFHDELLGISYRAVRRYDRICSEYMQKPLNFDDLVRIAVDCYDQICDGLADTKGPLTVRDLEGMTAILGTDVDTIHDHANQCEALMNELNEDKTADSNNKKKMLDTLMTLILSDLVRISCRAAAWNDRICNGYSEKPLSADVLVRIGVDNYNRVCGGHPDRKGPLTVYDLGGTAARVDTEVDTIRDYVEQCMDLLAENVALWQ